MTSRTRHFNNKFQQVNVEHDDFECFDSIIARRCTV